VRENVQLRAIVTQLGDFAARVSTGLDELSWLERRTIIRTLVAKIEIDETEATVVYRLPPSRPTPFPSEANGAGHGASGGEHRPDCLLRSRRDRLVTLADLLSHFFQGGRRSRALLCLSRMLRGSSGQSGNR
jgi:hypothetical protein